MYQDVCVALYVCVARRHSMCVQKDGERPHYDGGAQALGYVWCRSARTLTVRMERAASGWKQGCGGARHDGEGLQPGGGRVEHKRDGCEGRGVAARMIS